MRNIKYILSLVALAAFLNAVMDQFGFRLNDYGWEWHLVKIVMQGCYALAIWLSFDVKTIKRKNYWLLFVLFMAIFAVLTWAFHDVPYHYLFN